MQMKLSFFCFFSQTRPVNRSTEVAFILQHIAQDFKGTCIKSFLLVLVNLFGTVIRTQPSTKYLTYLNIWMITCIIFVCGPLFAYAVLLFHLRTAQSALESITIVKPDKEIPLIIAPNYYWRWDKICLTFFPLAFLLFNSVYWPVIVIN